MKLENGLPAAVTAAILLSALLFASCSPEEPDFTERDIASLVSWLESSRTMPSQLIPEDLAEDRALVFVQERLFRGDSFDLLYSLVPVLHDSGVRKIGLHFLPEGMDIRIPDEEAALELMKQADARLGYAEYRDFLLYLADFSRMAADDGEDLLIYGLGKNPSAAFLEEILYSSKGTGNEESDDSGEESPEPSAEDEEQPGIFLVMRQEQLSLIPEPPANLPPVRLIHHYLRHGGLVDTVVSERRLRDRSFAWRSTAGPVPEDLDPQWANPGDIIIVTSFDQFPVAPIEDFISEETVPAAMEDFPEVSGENAYGIMSGRMNRIIGRAVRDWNQ